MNKIKMQIKFDKLFVVDPVGRFRGMTVFWRDDLKIDKILYIDFTIELLIINTDRKFSWWCICVYANVDDTIREFQ